MLNTLEGVTLARFMRGINHLGVLANSEPDKFDRVLETLTRSSTMRDDVKSPHHYIEILICSFV